MIEDPVELLGPDEVTGRDIEFPAAELRDPLCIGKRSATGTELLDVGAELHGLAFQERGLLMQIKKDAGLRTKRRGIEGFGDVVDCARAISLCGVIQTLVERGEEDDRYVCSSWVLLYQLGGREAAQPGHLHVEKYQRVVATEKLA